MSRFVSALADIRSLFFYILFQLMLAGGNIIQMTNILLSDAGRSLNFTKNDAFTSDAIGKLYVNCIYICNFFVRKWRFGCYSLFMICIFIDTAV